MFIFTLKMTYIFLSNTDLYFSNSINSDSELIIIEDDECKHILNVMRHELNDELFITDGNGKIFKSIIVDKNKKSIECKILDKIEYKQKFSNITFCIPMLRIIDRLEFALEKCTELGVTNFILYKAKRSVAKAFNQKRIEKILISAIKQSLLSWLPKVSYANSVEEIASLPGEKIVFEQNSNLYFDNKIVKSNKNYFLVFGPEGGFSDEEVSFLDSSAKFKLADNRLRSETAIIKAASLL